MRGGMTHDISSASSVDVQTRAGIGGEPIMNGGAPYGNDFDPEDVSPAPSAAPAASPAHSQAGGRRRRHKMRGGTTSKMYALSPSNVEERALLA